MRSRKARAWEEIASECLGSAPRPQPKKMSLEQVLDAADRAQAQVASWPKWKRDLSQLSGSNKELVMPHIGDRIRLVKTSSPVHPPLGSVGVITKVEPQSSPPEVVKERLDHVYVDVKWDNSPQETKLVLPHDVYTVIAHTDEG